MSPGMTPAIKQNQPKKTPPVSGATAGAMLS